MPPKEKVADTITSQGPRLHRKKKRRESTPDIGSATASQANGKSLVFTLPFAGKFAKIAKSFVLFPDSKSILWWQ